MRKGSHQKGQQLKVFMMILFDSTAIFIICQHKGDILVRPDDLGDPSLPNAALANPKMLWPSGVVEYKFYPTFPRCLNISKVIISVL